MKHLSDMIEANQGMTKTARVMKAINDGYTSNGEICNITKFSSKFVASVLCNLEKRGVIRRGAVVRAKGKVPYQNFYLTKPLDQIVVKEMMFNKQGNAQITVRKPQAIRRELKLQWGANAQHSGRVRSVLSGILDATPVMSNIRGGFTASWNVSDPIKEQNAKDVIKMLRGMDIPINASIEAEKVIPRHTEIVSERL